MENRRNQAQQRLATLKSQLENSRKALQQAAAAQKIVADNQEATTTMCRHKANNRRWKSRRGANNCLPNRQRQTKALALAESDIKTLSAQLQEIASAEAIVATLQAAVTEQIGLRSSFQN